MLMMAKYIRRSVVYICIEYPKGVALLKKAMSMLIIYRNECAALLLCLLFND